MEFCTLFSVMDSGDPIVSIAESHQSEVPNSGFDGVMEKVSSVFNSTVEFEPLDENAISVSLLEETGNFEPLSEKDVERSTFLEAFGGLTIAKDSKEGDDTKSTDKSKKVQDSGTAIKHSNPKSIMTSVKSKDEKSGSITLNKPFSVATNWRSSSDRQIAGSIRSIHSTVAKKVASAASAACHALQQPAQSYRALPALSTRETQSLREQAKHKPPAKVEEYTHSASFPTVKSAKPRRVGRLPSYGFSLRCDERAQKRKEFHLKLEEKSHAKEVEQSTLQAKSKESLEVEVKMLRRCLTFKATPMPSFYHEPAPPKVEFKKIAPTRARSPKLGRHKRSSLMTASKLSGNRSSQSVQLNLDEKVTQNPTTKESSLNSFKKPLKKSFPRSLPEKTSTLANTTEDATFRSQRTEQHKIEPEAGQRLEPCQIQTGLDAVL
ncbi:protein WVD2-like 6 [Carya illinoinensis]|nr:protein WVD2-like 6 [Carya illinoinensis]